MDTHSQVSLAFLQVGGGGGLCVCTHTHSQVTLHSRTEVGGSALG